MRRTILTILIALAWVTGVWAQESQGPRPASAAGFRIVIASDSTAADYGPALYPQMGWGMVLKCSLDPSVEVINLARGGRSTRTYRSEGLWSQLVAGLRPGDTVLIQFGHNDEDRVKMERHTEADGEFSDNYRRFVAEVRAAGAHPVLLTPITRHTFAGARLQDAHGPYAAAIRRVAGETRAPLIDLDADSMAAVQALGEAGSRKLFLFYTPEDKIARFPQGSRDFTHTSEQGARLAAALVARRLARIGLPISAKVHPAATADLAVLGAPSCPPR